MKDEHFIGKLFKIGDSLGITIPSTIVDYSKLKAGDIVDMVITKKEE